MILHTDGDGFFASVERAQFPSLRGKPVVVGRERGIVLACTYEAKRLGITRGMHIHEVEQHFPSVSILDSHFELYTMYAEKIQMVLRRFCTSVEAYSIDECFAIIDDEIIEQEGGPIAYLQKIKQHVQTELGITFSFGLAVTKSLAKLASKYRKPDGCVVILSGLQAVFLQATPIDTIWGIGNQTTDRLQQMGIKTAYDFTMLSEQKVQSFFTVPIQEIWHELSGRVIYQVCTTIKIPKSLQTTRTFSPISNNTSYIFSELSKNMEIVFERLRNHALQARHVSFSLKTSTFSYRTREVMLPYATNNPSNVLQIIAPLYTQLIAMPALYYRATSITLSSLEYASSVQRDLFGLQDMHAEKNSLLHTIDALKNRYGTNTLYLASSMCAVNRRSMIIRKKNIKSQFISGLPYPYLGEVW